VAMVHDCDRRTDRLSICHKNILLSVHSYFSVFQFCTYKLHVLLFVGKKQKEEVPEEVKSGVFVFSNGDRYGMVCLNERELLSRMCTHIYMTFSSKSESIS